MPPKVRSSSSAMRAMEPKPLAHLSSISRRVIAGALNRPQWQFLVFTLFDKDEFLHIKNYVAKIGPDFFILPAGRGGHPISHTLPRKKRHRFRPFILGWGTSKGHQINP